MEIHLYICNSDRRYLEKNIYNKKVVNATLKNIENEDNLELVLKYNKDYLNYNYCYIPEFNSYYYIKDRSFVPGQEIIISLECDVLFTMKDDIKKSVGHIVRSKNGNRYIVDNLATQTSKNNWQCKQIGKLSSSSNSYILIKGGN